MKFTRRIVTLALALVLWVGTMTISASAAGTIMYGIGFVKGDSLRLRSAPSTTSEALTTASRNECVAVIGKTGEWYQVSYNLQTGYMHQDYLDVATRENAELGYGRVTGSGVNLRSGPSTSHGKVATAQSGDKCYIIGINDGWYKVIFNGTICYIRSDFLELTEIPYENQASSNTPKYFRLGKSTGTLPGGSAPSESRPESTGSASGSEILAEAKKYLGVPYVYGGASPSGFDCSGFVYYVLKQVGISAYRTPADQWNQGSSVARSDLEPGDVVFFANTAGAGLSHVGIYAGSGQFIHSPNSRSTVSYSDLSSGYWSDHYYGAKRMS